MAKLPGGVKKKLGFTTVLGSGASIGFGIYNTVSDIKEGKGVIGSIAKNAIETGVMELMGGTAQLAFMGYSIAEAGVKAAFSENAERKAFMSKQYKRFGEFQDSQNAYTLRQRSLNEMNQSGGNLRSVFGSEARQFYRKNSY
jgi:hypothetical protein